MNCYNHNAVAAVATCPVCNRNYCRKCFDAVDTEKIIMCPKCVVEDQKKYLAALVEQEKKNKTFLIIAGIAYVIGIIMFLSGLSGTEQLIIIGLLLMGVPAIPMALRFSYRVDDMYPVRYETVNGTTTKGLNNMGCGLQIFLALAVIFLGVIITPILILKTKLNLSKTQKEIEKLNEDMPYTELGLQELLEELKG